MAPPAPPLGTAAVCLARLGRSSTVCELNFLPTHRPTEAECADASLYADTVLDSTELRGARTRTDPTDTTKHRVKGTNTFHAIRYDDTPLDQKES